MVTWPGSTEHSGLLSTAESLVNELRGLRDRLEHDPEIEYAQHRDFANRARSLADYLHSVILLTKTDTYAPAFANLRTALEHVLVDHLIFSGQGLKSEPDEDGRSFIISPHYVLLPQYQPYWGPPGAQHQFNHGLSDGQDEVRFAKENALIYHSYLDWRSIKKNLLSNGFADETVIRQLEVHYRFLSAFVHPISNITELIYGRNVFDTPTYDHYSSELALLYVIAFAVQEICNFREMTLRYPSVGISEWQTTESLCGEAWDRISYLRFPGHPPHQYDRIEEANRRAFRNSKAAGGIPSQVEDPASIPDNDIGYYRDPIARLIALHSCFGEVTTGLRFISPWPRNDARFR
jgi:hypothetical protein